VRLCGEGSLSEGSSWARGVLEIYGAQDLLVRSVGIQADTGKVFTSRSLYSDNTAAEFVWLLPHLSVFKWLHITCI
jgi:hypothetical protein